MRIVTRYVLREFIATLLYCLIAFCMIFVIVDLFENLDDFLENRPAWTYVAAYYVCHISQYLIWIVPAVLLLASLYTMWRFAHKGELTAMRAGGIPFTRITAPLLGVAAGWTLILSLAGEFFIPDAVLWSRMVSADNFGPAPTFVRENIPYYNYSSRRYWTIEKLSLRDPGVLHGVEITQETPNQTRRWTLSAPTAEYLDGVWWMRNPQKRFFDEQDQPLPLSRDPLWMLEVRPMPELEETPRDIANEIRPWEYFSIRSMLRYLEAHPSMPEATRREKLYDLHFRVAIPWSAIVITLFAIPAGVATGRQSVVRGIILAIGLFLLFFAMTFLCEYGAQVGWLTPWIGAWLPNLVFFLAGLVLFQNQR